jgi:hypothetical protein
MPGLGKDLEEARAAAGIIMLVVPSVSVDPAELLHRVRKEVARKGPGVLTPPYLDAGPPPENHLSAHLNHARLHAGVGLARPTLRRVPGPLRPLARLFCKLLFKVADRFTVPQRAVNHCLIEAIAGLAAQMEYKDRQVALLQASLRSIHQTLREQQFSSRDLANLQSQVEFLDGWVRDRLAAVGETILASEHLAVREDDLLGGD